MIKLISIQHIAKINNLVQLQFQKKNNNCQLGVYGNVINPFQ